MGYYAAIEGNDLSEKGFTQAIEATRQFQTFEKERLCVIQRPMPVCTISQVAGSISGYVVMSTLQGWMQDQPLSSQTVADFYMKALKDALFCE